MSAAKTLASIAAPAPQVVEEPTVQVKQQSAKQKARIDKGLPETHVEQIRVDGLALMKIIKHSREAHVVHPAPPNTSNATVTFTPAVGQLLGIDSNGVLEVSNAFGLPAGTLGGSTAETDGAESRGVKAATKYSTQLLSRMNDLNADASVVGFYTSTNNGQILATGGFLDALVGAQLSGGGVGSGQKAQPTPRPGLGQRPAAQLASGEQNKSGKGIALVYDIASATQGAVGLRAYRASPQFVEAYRAGKFDTAALIENKLVPSNILEEVPVVVHSNALLTAFLSTLTSPSASATSSLSTPSFSPLSLPAPSPSSHVPSTSVPAPLTQPLQHLLTALDTHQAHLSTLSFQSRQLARDRARLESSNPALAKRRQENEQRAREGLPPLPPSEDEIKAGLKEPSRLETMCALAAVEGAAKSLSEATGTGVVRAYGAKAGAEVASA
ncbi:uncharacterized protein JCM15063_001276 [Sporobolomyces koalae]|uniref:uncharacterized protein n=1 Tax=Sporobolomyces koalae TaxID=500713 RepID=UPI00317D0989